jgi:hypothetical protein
MAGIRWRKETDLDGVASLKMAGILEHMDHQSDEKGKKRTETNLDGFAALKVAGILEHVGHQSGGNGKQKRDNNNA